MSAECARLAVDLERLLPKVDADDLDEDRRIAFAEAALSKIAALEAAARTAPPQPPPAMSRRDQLFARPLTGRSRLDDIGHVEEDYEGAWAADLEEELFS